VAGAEEEEEEGGKEGGEGKREKGKEKVKKENRKEPHKSVVLFWLGVRVIKLMRGREGKECIPDTNYVYSTYEMAELMTENDSKQNEPTLETIKQTMYEERIVECEKIAQMNGRWSHFSEPMVAFVKTHKVLMYDPQRAAPASGRLGSLALYLTEKQVGFHILLAGEEGVVNVEENRPFYWFDSDLTRKDMLLLNNLYPITGFPQTSSNRVGRVHSDLFHREWNIGHILELYLQKYLSWSFGPSFFTARRRRIDAVELYEWQSTTTDFQTILCLIPGRYRNGPWRPLDGFFGPYLNEETLELSSLIPEWK